MPYIVLILSAAVAALDYIVKLLVMDHVKPVGKIAVIPGLFSLTYVENRGAAFGILSNARWIFITVTILIIVLLIYVIFKYKVKSPLFNAALILIIGGGFGNLIDRIFYGYVVDYLSVSFFPPVCNLADYCISVGAVLMAIYMIFFSEFFNKKRGSSND